MSAFTVSIINTINHKAFGCIKYALTYYNQRFLFQFAMKTFLLKAFAQLSIIQIILIVLTTASAAPAHAEESIEIIDGVIYVINYDSQTGTGEAWVYHEDYDYEGNNPEYGDSTCHILDEVSNGFGTFPVTKICDGAFAGCTKYNSIAIPTTVDTIGESAFAHTTIQRFVTYNSFQAEASTLVIMDKAFEDCQQLEEVYFGIPVSKIGNKGFMNCAQLRYFEINDYDDDQNALTYIGSLSFADCSSLYYFTIPQNVTEIGTGAFLYCTSITSISIPESVTSLGSYAFAECSSLEDVDLYCNLSTISEGTFLKCTSLNQIIIPNSVTTIEDYAFNSCHALNYIKLSDNLNSIGMQTFAGCYELSYIDIPNSVTSIGEEAFFGGRVGIGLWHSYNLPNSEDHFIQVHERSYSYNLGALKTIKIGSSVNSIGAHAFLGQIPDKITCMNPCPPSLLVDEVYDYGVFDEIAYDSTTLCVPTVVVNAYKTAYGWENFLNVEGIEIMGNGDANGDGQIDITDVVVLIDAILGYNNTMPTFNPINADIDADGNITINDATSLIDKLLED